MFVHNKKTYFCKPEILSSRYFPHQQTACQLKDRIQTTTRRHLELYPRWDLNETVGKEGVQTWRSVGDGQFPHREQNNIGKQGVTDLQLPSYSRTGNSG